MIYTHKYADIQRQREKQAEIQVGRHTSKSYREQEGRNGARQGKVEWGDRNRHRDI